MPPNLVLPSHFAQRRPRQHPALVICPGQDVAAGAVLERNLSRPVGGAGDGHGGVQKTAVTGCHWAADADRGVQPGGVPRDCCPRRVAAPMSPRPDAGATARRSHHASGRGSCAAREAVRARPSSPGAKCQLAPDFSWFPVSAGARCQPAPGVSWRRLLLSVTASHCSRSFQHTECGPLSVGGTALPPAQARHAACASVPYAPNELPNVGRIARPHVERIALQQCPPPRMRPR